MTAAATSSLSSTSTMNNSKLAKIIRMKESDFKIIKSDFVINSQESVCGTKKLELLQLKYKSKKSLDKSDEKILKNLKNLNDFSKSEFVQPLT